VHIYLQLSLFDACERLNVSVNVCVTVDIVLHIPALSLLLKTEAKRKSKGGVCDTQNPLHSFFFRFLSFFFVVRAQLTKLHETELLTISPFFSVLSSASFTPVKGVGGGRRQRGTASFSSFLALFPFFFVSLSNFRPSVVFHQG
jgi:hypothetical protein